MKLCNYRTAGILVEQAVSNAFGAHAEPPPRDLSGPERESPHSRPLTRWPEWSFRARTPRAWPSALATWFFDLNPITEHLRAKPIGEQYLNRANRHGAPRRIISHYSMTANQIFTHAARYAEPALNHPRVRDFIRWRARSLPRGRLSRCVFGAPSTLMTGSGAGTFVAFVRPLGSL